jgi:hypothetical protein
MEFDGNKIYPTLSSAPPLPNGDHINTAPLRPPQTDGGHWFRLRYINDIQKILENERDRREKLSKKYHRAVQIIGNVDAVLGTASMAFGAVGVGLLATVVALPVAIAMEATAIGTTVIGIIGERYNKKLMQKAEKHEKIKVLTEAKMNTISGLISKALINNTISDNEYVLILSEFTKYKRMKDEIRKNGTTNSDTNFDTSLADQLDFDFDIPFDTNKEQPKRDPREEEHEKYKRMFEASIYPNGQVIRDLLKTNV